MNRTMACMSPFAKSGQIASPFTGKLLQEQVIIYSAELGLANFTSSNGWLQAFQKHHGIRSAPLFSETADVSMATIDGRENVMSRFWTQNPTFQFRLGNTINHAAIVLMFFLKIISVHICKCILHIINT